MADVVLFHHAQGLTPGVLAIADRLRAAGHSVTIPDLYDGATFDVLDDGVAHAESIGIEHLVAAALSAVDAMPDRLVYGGFSLGALAAHRLAQTRSGALGALLYHYGDVPMEAFGDTWPAGVDVQLHLNQDDEWREGRIAEDFVTSVARSARAELFLYPGSSHLFTDAGLPEYEPDSADLVIERTLEFLARVDQH